MPNAPKCAECGQVHLAGANGAIYCCGPLLRAVQMTGLYKDCKYFVDMSCRYSPERILADFQLFSSCKKNETSVKHLTNFVDNHFDQPGTEMEYWCPPDWRMEPAFLAQIKDPQLKKFGSDLNRIWKQLGRNMKDCVRTSPQMYSLVYVPNPFIVPGGRFLEFYYWDTYWIVRGLLYTGMHQTARGMIDNLLYMVQQYKAVPNGGRVYYWGRSQPPLLVLMVKAFLEFTKDDQYVLRILPLLEMEMDNFLKNHSVQVEGRTMYQYRDKSSGPRPESYREDVASAAGFCSDDEKEEHYANLKAACESGMDFSSRWFVSPCGTNVGTLANIKTSWIVPVDLNCILFRSCKTLAEFNNMAGNTAKAQQYRNIACGLIKAITAVLWNEKRGVWLDYDLKNKTPRDYFVVTNLSPLWLHAYPIADNEKISKSVMDYIEENKLDSFPGGVPHTLSNTGQQWDYPNVWPPMMLMLIEGLNNLGTPEADEMSKRWRERWVRTNYEAFSKTGFMHEKYNCEELGAAACNGEHQPQTGFGWTNGVLIELLARYGEELTASDADPNCGAEEAAANEPDCNCRCDDEENLKSALEGCPITSEAYLEQKAAEEGAVSQDCDCPQDVYNAQDVASFATSENPCAPGCPNFPSTPNDCQAQTQAPIAALPCQPPQPPQSASQKQCPKYQQAPLPSAPSPGAQCTPNAIQSPKQGAKRLSAAAAYPTCPDCYQYIYSAPGQQAAVPPPPGGQPCPAFQPAPVAAAPGGHICAAYQQAPVAASPGGQPCPSYQQAPAPAAPGGQPCPAYQQAPAAASPGGRLSNAYQTNGGQMNQNRSSAYGGYYQNSYPAQQAQQPPVAYSPGGQQYQQGCQAPQYAQAQQAPQYPQAPRYGQGQQAQQYPQYSQYPQAAKSPAANAPCGVCNQGPPQAKSPKMQSPQPRKSDPAAVPCLQTNQAANQMRQSPNPYQAPLVDPASEVCSVCCGACGRQKEAAAMECPEPQPIQIEEGDVNCMLDLSPSEAEELRALCPCDGTADADADAEKSDMSDCADGEDDCSFLCDPVPIMNKLFPLADDIKCPLPVEPEESDTEACQCYKNKEEKETAVEKDCD
ncbi:uncharacterized protein [Drosophila virilis]|uniref:Trehalase n=1 Tax=Drosophila virilis TaxID=7244 RepID=B4LME0_DROVI|nr:uncharacterized protein LOC6626840 [Drosophila virilis]EDW62035.1 uncharacterized protein Dvir_GJ22372 [Drosophila virilis]